VNRPLSKFKREPARVKLVLTARDTDILLALNRYRYLTTSQIKDLLFSENADTQGARRRLKKLFHGKYVGRVSTFKRVDEGMPQIAYYLDRKGAKLLDETGHVPNLWRKSKQVKMQFLQHALDLSEFRIHLEKGLQTQDVVRLHTFIPDFRMRQASSRSVSKHRYELYMELQHPVNRQSYVIYPDAVIVLEAEIDGRSFKRLYFLEIDRGTHGLEKIRDKVTGYNLYFKKDLHKKYGDFDDFKILFQTSSPKRANNIRNCLVDQERSESVWITDYEKVTDTSLLHTPIWQNIAGEPKQILITKSEKKS